MKIRNCRHCGIEMPTGTNTCPACKKTQIYVFRVAILLAFFVLALGAVIYSSFASNGNTSNKTSSKTNTTLIPKLTISASSTPTFTSNFTNSNAQTEQNFKGDTKNTTVVDLVKLGSGDMYSHVHFTCVIYDFLQDKSGITTAANVVDPKDSSSVIQIQFPSGTFIQKVNKGDIIELWGVDDGSLTSQNAYGATIQEVSIYGRYMTDHTTNYIE